MVEQLAGNGLQAWEVADASEPSSIGKVEFFRDYKLQVTEK